MDFIDYFAKEWAVIWQAPATFLTAMFLVALAIFIVVRWSYHVRLDSQAARLKLKDDQIADLERKLADIRETLNAPQPAATVPTAGPAPRVVAPRSDILRRITQLYVFEHDGISPGILAGSELPPESFINDQLAKMGEPWRVRNIQGAVAESYDV